MSRRSPPFPGGLPDRSDDRRPARQRSKRDLVMAAERAVAAGDLDAAAALFSQAVTTDPRNPELFYQLGLVHEGLQDIDLAAVAYTQALAVAASGSKPQLTAAQRLARLLNRYQISDFAGLSYKGLHAAMKAPGVPYQALAEAALQQQFARPGGLCQLAAATAGGIDAARRTAAGLLRRAAPELADPLLTRALSVSVVRVFALEQALTALRAALLLDCSAAAFDDPGIVSLTLAMLAQGDNNDHAWAVSDAEAAALATLTLDVPALLAGDRGATRVLLLLRLYAGLREVVGRDLAVADLKGIKPKLVRAAVAEQVRDAVERRQLAAGLRQLRPLSDATSMRVAGQYEQSPYPRWQTLTLTPAGQLRASLERFFGATALGFMDRPFDCLVAGTGTGQQVLQSAVAYGPLARVTGIDLSLASLGYAGAKARTYRVDTVTLIHGDILDADLLGQRFDIIECVGVLHHMADPWEGWRVLQRQLKPGGLMYIGLYSATARAGLRALRMEPGYPGPGCGDTAARAYRAELLGRDADALGAEVRQSRNAYALAEFRDLMLHESEQQMTLPEIAAYLCSAGLTFRGFTLPAEVTAAFLAAYPDHPWPGRLEDWTHFEAANPHTFDGMYCFWCDAETLA
jgi:SAM-dependent methyltransferase